MMRFSPNRLMDSQWQNLILWPGSCIHQDARIKGLSLLPKRIVICDS
jgi:hypothetical protein